MSVVLHDLAVASKLSMDDAWQHVLKSMSTVRSARQRIALTTAKDINPGPIAEVSPLAMIAAVDQDNDRVPVATGVVSVGELLILGEAVGILARIQFDSPMELAASVAAGLGCSTIQMLLEDLIQNADSMVLETL